MQIEQAKQICKHFTPVEKSNGKVTCVHHVDKMCDLPQYFLCEIVMHKQHGEWNNNKNRLPVMSTSRAGVFHRCPRKYAFQYLNRIEPPIRPEYFAEGTGFTTVRSKLDSGLVWDGTLPWDMEEKRKRHLAAILRFYSENPPYKILTVTSEIPVSFEHKGYLFRGWLDGLTKHEDGSETIVEWKYAAGMYSKHKISVQAAIYLKGRPKAKKFHLYVAIKPKTRPKKNETWDEYEERVYQNLVEKGPQEVFRAMQIKRESLNIDGILDRLAESMNMLEVAKENGMPPCFSQCRDCDYEKLCSQHIGKSTLQIIRDVKGVEIESF